MDYAGMGLKFTRGLQEDYLALKASLETMTGPWTPRSGGLGLTQEKPKK
ncbi:MAG: hypothetical protein LBE27_06445 [Deltaproteobacteria bacterium]|nr:hypothetical protein [Deltaproteobacteria bacterium]